MESSYIRREVMQTIEKSMEELLAKYLKSVDDNWQPADLLPDARDDSFFEEIEEKPQIQEIMTKVIGSFYNSNHFLKKTGNREKSDWNCHDCQSKREEIEEIVGFSLILTKVIGNLLSQSNCLFDL